MKRCPVSLTHAAEVDSERGCARVRFVQREAGFPQRGKARCDKASDHASVMLHLRACHASKAAILTIPADLCRSKIEVPLEFQGLGSLGAACGDGFSLASLTTEKERVCGCTRSVGFRCVRSLCNGPVRVGEG